MKTVIHVNGMMCPHCKATVEKVCKAVPGTLDAVADLAVIKAAITDAGYEVVE